GVACAGQEPDVDDDVVEVIVVVEPGDPGGVGRARRGERGQGDQQGDDEQDRRAGRKTEPRAGPSAPAERENGREAHAAAMQTARRASRMRRDSSRAMDRAFLFLFRCRRAFRSRPGNTAGRPVEMAGPIESVIPDRAWEAPPLWSTADGGGYQLPAV